MTEKDEISPRDHLANERTFLAWIRTSLAIMGLGFVTIRFSMFLEQLSGALNHSKIIAPSTKEYSSPLGIALVALGTVITVYSFIRYYSTEKQLVHKVYRPSLWPLAILTLIILFSGIFIVIYLTSYVR